MSNRIPVGCVALAYHSKFYNVNIVKMEKSFNEGPIEEIIELKPKRSWWKFAIGVVGVVVLVIVGYVGWQAVDQWRGERQIQQLARDLEKTEEEIYQAQLADTYGGQTPQETLQLYIVAVEKGDYELASKYFVIENQSKELESFEGATSDEVSKYVLVLDDVLDNGGEYSRDKSYFSFNGSILTRMTLYPSGVWKIIEI